MLVVDDLISPHMVPLILTAASEGLLVFVSIAAPSTSDAVQRFVELAPPEMRNAVQSAMAESFRGAVAQVLLKKSRRRPGRRARSAARHRAGGARDR